MLYPDNKPPSYAGPFGFGLIVLLLALLFGWGPWAPQPSQAQAPGYSIDPRLGALGVTISRATPAAGEQYWALVDVQWLDEAQARGRHHIDVELVNEQGARILGTQALVSWSSGSGTLTIEDKPAPEYGANFPMYAASCAYSVKALGLASDSINCVGLGSIEERWRTIHTTYRLIFQRTTRGGGPPTATHTPQPPQGWAIREVLVEPNCGLTQLKGSIKGTGGAPVLGSIEVSWPGMTPQQGPIKALTDAQGRWEVFLSPGEHSAAFPGWRVRTFDRSGFMLAEGDFMTDAYSPQQPRPCLPGGPARNVLTLETAPRGTAPTATQQPQPTATRSPTASPRPSPSPTQGPGPQPSATRTPEPGGDTPIVILPPLNLPVDIFCPEGVPHIASAEEGGLRVVCREVPQGAP